MAVLVHQYTNFTLLVSPYLKDLPNATSQQGLLSEEAHDVLIFLNYAVIGTSIALLGICANIINIATFTKQGFKETITISLTALAFADISSLIVYLSFCTCFNKYLAEALKDYIDLFKISFIAAAVFRSYFTLVGAMITFLLTFERFLCVFAPLKVKTIFTRRKLVISIVFLSVFVTFCHVPILFTSSLVLAKNPRTNGTIISLHQKQHLGHLDDIAFGGQAALGMTNYVTITLFTVITVRKLASQRAWAQSNSTATAKNKDNTENSENSGTKGNKDKTIMSDKKRKATKSVILIATIYIVCFLPSNVVQMLMVLIPDFNKGQLYERMYEVAWSLANIIEAIGSSSNIFVYMKTSTKYREAFFARFKLERK